MLESGTCKTCWGSGGHSAYNEELGEMETHTCETCKGTGLED